MKRIIAFAFFALVCFESFFCTVSAIGTTHKFTDEVSRRVTEIKLANGVRTGVNWTNISLDGNTYGRDREVNIAEFDLADTHLSLEVINSGKYMVSSSTVDKAASAYNTDHKGQTVLAAVNGDLWMTAVHSSKEVTSKTLKVSRGVLIIDREIWATEQIDAENKAATNEERGTPSPPKSAFGVTDENQPLVGSPDISITMTLNGKGIEVDGLNRLPALDSLIVYNHRVNSSNYVLNDAYEIELEAVGGTAFTLDGTVRGRVKAIYPSGSQARPAINEDSIILTARGAAIDRIIGIKIGDDIEFSASLTDRFGRTELWQNVTDAIGGHMQTICDGKSYGALSSSKTSYPTALIGYKSDGTVAFITVTSSLDNSRAALSLDKAYKFCREYGYHNVFYLDGGGSTTFVTLEDGSYVTRNKCSDGAPRAVINSVAVVYNDTPICEKQGDIGYVKSVIDYSEIPPTYVDGALLAEICNGQNSLESGYDHARKAYRLKALGGDPYVCANFSDLAPAKAEEYPYIVMKIKSDAPSDSTFALYYSAGENYGASEERVTRFKVESGMGKWQYAVIDMRCANGWSGNINSIRLDPFDTGAPTGQKSVYIGAIVLCKSYSEANKVKDGYIPYGAIGDFFEYKKSLENKEAEKTEATTAGNPAALTSATQHVTASTERKGGCRALASLPSAIIIAAFAAVITQKKNK